MEATFAGEPPVLDVKGAARLLRLHAGTVMRLARTGKLPAFRYARHWRFHKDDLSSWLAAHRFVPPSVTASDTTAPPLV